eukprot:TRINITY_DN4461_c0_g1_i2.p1 TRINITY_DN4461_c0_g1~~TRINITY_DN4461_c0_g1_i2.p1  ORF type:complete len:337 (-),score=38.52 TRINITY_DN4461_c0_g1_i2:27-1001(-)
MNGDHALTDARGPGDEPCLSEAPGKRLEELPLEILGVIMTSAGINSVLKLSVLSKWWHRLGNSELVWREQCFQLYEFKNRVSQSHHQVLVGVQSFTEQKGEMSWRDYWFALKKNAHFIACCHCKKYPLMNCRYDCINCVGYTLCVDCEGALVHPKSHILAKMDHPVVTKFYFQWNGPFEEPEKGCFMCHTSPLGGPHYWNNFKKNQSACLNCFEKIETERQDWYKQVLPDFAVFSPEDLGKNHRGAWCDICSKPSVPINWKCTCCYDYDLCSDCALNKKHTKKHAILKIYWSRFNRWSFNYLKPSNRWKDGEHKDDSDYEEIVV